MCFFNVTSSPMKLRQSLRNMSLLLLAAVFFLASGVVSIHDHEHSHDHAVSHSQEDEADACHRSIYHGDLNLGCEHKSHVHDSDLDCQLCDFINNRCDQDLVQAESLLSFSGNNENSFSPLQSRSFNQDYEHGQRGPPRV
ncbi:MAG: hypothetical protein ACI85F_000150 [Bacteroidia bacterium]|jgi:hypothetical protein